MRKHKTLKIDDREITVKELRVRDIMEAFSGSDNAADFMGKLETLLPRFTDGITPADLQEMAPSEIKSIYDAFKEVNAVFFALAQEMGLAGAFAEIKEAIKREFSGALAGSLSRVMPGQLTTAIPIS